MTLYADRTAAGRALAERLISYQGHDDIVVLALPRGGVPVAFEVAKALGAPLDVMVVRKLGVPGHEELAMGAIASGGVCVMNHDIVRNLFISPRAIDAETSREREELERRERAYRGERPPVPVADRIAIVIDDGIATGATMRAAVSALKQRQSARIIVAVPTAAASSCAILRAEVDELICLETPEPFISVGSWYRDFAQTSDEEVKKLLEQAA